MLKIFDRFFTDESSSWEPSRKTPLHLNFQTESLNGVRIGDAPEKLRVFGRPDNRQPFKNSRFEYHLLGFEAEHEDGQIINFCFMVNPLPSAVLNYFGNATYKEGPPEFANCELVLTAVSGRQLNINRFTTSSDVERILGAPDDEDSGVKMSSYRQNRLSLVFSFQEDETIEEIIVETWTDEN